MGSPMYKSIQIKNFRCFSEFALSDIKQINLITGINNVGKTSLLEAIFLHCGAYNPSLTLTVNANRGLGKFQVELSHWADTPWNTFFHNFNQNSEIEISGEYIHGKKRTLKLRSVGEEQFIGDDQERIRFYNEEIKESLSADDIHSVLSLEHIEGNDRQIYNLTISQSGIKTKPAPPPPPRPAYFLSTRKRIAFEEEAQRYSNIVMKKQENFILEGLQKLDDRIEKIETLVHTGRAILHAHIGLDRPIPLPLLGEGMARLTSIMLHIGNAKDGIVIIDELDNGFHYSGLEKLWRIISGAAMSFNAQIFATTHSLESIQAAKNVFINTDPSMFILHRLDRLNNNIDVKNYSSISIDTAFNSGFELR